MKANFELEKHNRPVLVLVPEYGQEDILLAAFMRYDANIFTASVERHENGRIAKVTIYASEAE